MVCHRKKPEIFFILHFFNFLFPLFILICLFPSLFLFNSATPISHFFYLVVEGVDNGLDPAEHSKQLDRNLASCPFLSPPPPPQDGYLQRIAPIYLLDL